MTAPNKFIFFDKDKKRWKKVLFSFQMTFFLLDVLIAAVAFAVFSKPVVSNTIPDFLLNQPKEVIDAISKNDETIIFVTGIGPLTEIKKNGGAYTIERSAFNHDKRVILTFDDGPDPTFTPLILDVLKQHQIQAVFFVVGEQVSRYPDLVQRMVQEGHQLGNHTFSHTPEYIPLYYDEKRLSLEFDFTQKIIKSTTGYNTELFRIPYWGQEDTISLNSLVLLATAQSKGYKILSSTTDSFDWQETNPDRIVSHAYKPTQSQVILLHDAGGDRTPTILALPKIIALYQRAGYQFVTADALFSTPLMSKTSLPDKFVSDLASGAFWMKIHFMDILNFIFKFSLILMGLSIFMLLNLAVIHLIKGMFSKKIKSFNKKVSILVPAYNEENTIGKTLQSLLKSNYPDYEIIIINNNSSDSTVLEALKYVDNKRVKLLHETKQGKHFALNYGIEKALGEVVVVVDADTQVLPDTILNLVQPFKNPKVGATAGNIKVGNVNNVLTALQQLEYIAGLQIDKRAYDVLHAIPVVPGALGAWKKEALVQTDGYTGDTLTEDADLTIKIQRLGYRIHFIPEAISLTEAPDNLSVFLKQRFRWSFGILQVLFKHKDMFFKPRHGLLGMVVLPFLSFQIFLMLFSPLIDLLAIIFLIFLSPFQTTVYLTIYILLHLTLVIIALILGRETRVWLVFFVPLQRFFYQIIWYFIIYRSVITALKGFYVPWVKIDHNGSVDLVPTASKNLAIPQTVTNQVD